MDNVSVSKGIFAHKGRYTIGDKRKRFKPPDYYSEPWYLAYNEAWTNIEKSTENIRTNMFQQILVDLESFVLKVKDKSNDGFENEIPTAILLTGVNVPDHAILFQTIVSKLEPQTKHIAIIWSRDSNNMKSLMEETISQLINSTMSETSAIKKSRCSMRNLKLWYQEYCESNEPLIIIITDFESSSASVLHDFISVLSSYSDQIKFILIFGVATTLHAIHRSLSYDVTSKLNVRVFHMQTQVNILSVVLESTVFSSEIPFKLTGRAFQLLTDLFLFYDFSVESFLQSYKICMIQHFYANNINSLCCQTKDIEHRISLLTEDDLEGIKDIPSIKKHIQKLCNEGKLKELNNDKFKEILRKVLRNFHKYMNKFLTVLRCFHSLTSTLPNSPLGKQLREFYTKAVYMTNITESQEYKECLQLLTFLSKKELLLALESVLKIVQDSKYSSMEKFKTNLQTHMETIQEASLDVTLPSSSNVISADEKLSRAQLKEKLLKMSQSQSRSPYKVAQMDLINFLDQAVFSVYLINPNQVPGHEIFCFNDGNLAKQHIRGSLRAAIHTGLNDPQMYLNCDCCKLENDDAIPSTLPDLSIIYKLHLESTKLINMYDWLQAFLIITNPTSDAGEQREVDPKLQARFTQAVAELEFLGFIKTSRQKTDHVKRLT